MKHSLLALFLAAAFSPRAAQALPTMIRLGYVNCAACHVAPQGGGLLNAYGRSIDEAQSLRGGEYAPTTNALIRALSWNGRFFIHQVHLTPFSALGVDESRQLSLSNAIALNRGVLRAAQARVQLKAAPSGATSGFDLARGSTPST